MAIYLDSNAMYDWRTFGESSRLVLGVLAAELGQEIVVPSLVADELGGHMRRRLTDSADKFYAAADRAEELFDLEAITTEPFIAVDQTVARWRARLADAFSSCQVTAESASEGLQHEISGVPPARRDAKGHRGTGARDVAIWLSILKDTLRRGEPGYFVTRDDGYWDNARPRERLLGEITAAGVELTLHKTIESLVERLGEEHEVPLTADDVRDRMFAVIKQGLERSSSVPRAIFEVGLDRLEFRTVIRHGTIDKLNRVLQFDSPSGPLLLVDATWTLELDLRYRERASPGERQFGISDLDVTGSIQVYLGPSDAGQFIAAQLKSRYTIFRNENGTHDILTTLDE